MTPALLCALVLAFSPAAAASASGTDAAAIDAAIERAVAWIDALPVDPKALREERGMRGKKHFAEKLFAYAVLAKAESDPKKREAIVAKFAAAFAPARAREFHEFDVSDVKLLREESMSYLTALWLAARLGVPAPEGKASVAEKKAAIAKDLPNRAVHWQLAFAFLLGKLGHEPPESVESLARKTMLAAKRPTNSLSVEDVYGLVHEIFVLSSYGDEPVRWPTPESRLYAHAALPALVQRAIRDNDADLLAELLVAMRLSSLSAGATFEDGVRHLLGRQNPDGSFGTYERRRAELERAGSRFDVNVGGYLHTTEVALWALLEARAAKRAGPSTSEAAEPRPR